MFSTLFEKKASSITRCKPYLGTYVEVTITSNNSQDECLHISQKIFQEISRIESMMSFHNTTSELSRINNQAYHHVCPMSDDLNTIVEFALYLSRISKGAYDITIGSELVQNHVLPSPLLHANQVSNQTFSGTWRDIQLKEKTIRFLKPLLIDLGGIAKGFALDKAAALIPKGYDVTINAGGDIYMNNWKNKKVSIRPDHANPNVHTVSMTAPAMATSTGYHQGHNKRNIINKSTPNELNYKSVSVFASTGMLADACTKLVYLGKQSLLKDLKAKAIIIDNENNIKEL